MGYYKVYLGTRLEFPAGWAGIVVELGPKGCGFEQSDDLETLDFLFNRPFGFAGDYITDCKRYYFLHWHELLNALDGTEKENRQLHVMADLISWYCVGTGTPVLHDKIQPELPFL